MNHQVSATIAQNQFIPSSPKFCDTLKDYLETQAKKVVSRFTRENFASSFSDLLDDQIAEN